MAPDRAAIKQTMVVPCFSVVCVLFGYVSYCDMSMLMHVRVYIYGYCLAVSPFVPTLVRFSLAIPSRLCYRSHGRCNPYHSVTMSQCYQEAWVDHYCRACKYCQMHDWHGTRSYYNQTDYDCHVLAVYLFELCVYVCVYVQWCFLLVYVYGGACVSLYTQTIV